MKTYLGQMFACSMAKALEAPDIMFSPDTWSSFVDPDHAGQCKSYAQAATILRGCERQHASKTAG